MNPAETRFPSPVPDGDVPVADNPAFVSACMSAASEHAAAMGWRLGKSILTHSSVWGFVFRIDFRTRFHVENSKFANRLVYWSADQDDTIAGAATVIGQELEPL